MGMDMDMSSSRRDLPNSTASDATAAETEADPKMMAAMMLVDFMFEVEDGRK